MKLSKQFIERMILQKCSKQEINFIVLVAQWQNEFGTIHNLHYKNIIDILKIVPKTYFHIINNLEKKGIISIEDSDTYGFRHITLLENDFSDKSYNKSYLNINREFFYTNNFFDLKATEKYVLFKILLRSREDGRSVNISETTIAQYARINNKNRRLITSIIHALESFKIKNLNVFKATQHIGKTKDKIFSFILNVNKRRRKDNLHILTENEVRQTHMFKAYCRKNRVPATDKDIKDLIQMDNEYKKYSSVYIETVKELINQYRVKAQREGSIGFICATIRTKMIPIVARMKKYLSSSDLNLNYTYLI